MTNILILIIAALLIIAAFFGKELLKKFNFLRLFLQDSNQILEWNHPGSSKPGMRKVVLRGEKHFCALVGFSIKNQRLGYAGFDPFGFIKSDKNNQVVISIYLGRKPGEFRFFINTNREFNKIFISSNDDDQKLRTNITFKPHWFQQISG